jgi:hypothetical protein
MLQILRNGVAITPRGDMPKNRVHETELTEDAPCRHFLKFHQTNFIASSVRPAHRQSSTSGLQKISTMILVCCLHPIGEALGT